MTLRICMLLPIRYGPNMRVNPQIGIASYLVNFGHEICWVLSGENSRTGQRITLNGIEVHAAPYIHYFNEASLIGKGFNRILGMFKKARLALQTFKTSKYNVVFVREDTFDGIIGTIIKRKYKIPLVYELVDPLEQEVEGYRIENRKPLFLWQFLATIKASLKRYVMKKADLVLPTTGWFERDLSKIGIQKSKIMPFPNGVDLTSYPDPNRVEAIREKYHLKNCKVLLYLGVMAKMRKLEVLIEAFARAKETEPDIKLLLVGDGTGRNGLEKLATKLGVREDTIFTGQVPQAQVPDFIAVSDIGVSPVPPFSFYKVSSPIKMLEYMAMAKPVIANEEILEQREIIEQSCGGILVSFNIEAFASAMVEMLNDRERAKEMGRKGYEWVTKNRSFEILARRLERKYLQLIMPGCGVRN
ncbi:MAG: glycosyltransferase family 4 protein [Chloroflexi bacterium]|nr:glycosyltransferase family 4 protein [Chloroflexota bacterium]